MAVNRLYSEQLTFDKSINKYWASSNSEVHQPEYDKLFKRPKYGWKCLPACDDAEILESGISLHCIPRGNVQAKYRNII